MLHPFHLSPSLSFSPFNANNDVIDYIHNAEGNPEAEGLLISKSPLVLIFLFDLNAYEETVRATGPTAREANSETKTAPR